MRFLWVALVLIILVIRDGDSAILSIQDGGHEVFTEPQTKRRPEPSNPNNAEGAAQLAGLVAKKIKRLTRDIFKHAKTTYDRENLKSQLQIIIKETGQRNHYSKDDIQMCKKLIMDGIDFVLRSMEPTEPERRSNIIPKKVIKKKLMKRPADCVSFIRDVCVKLDRLKTLQCPSVGNVTLQNLCDGKADCLYGTDEQRCEDQIAPKIKTTERILNELDNSINIDNCFPMHKKTNHYVLSTQRADLKVVKETLTAEKKYHQGAISINMIAVALNYTFCTPKNTVNRMVGLDTVRSSEKPVTMPSTKKVEGVKDSWSVSSCPCDKGDCAGGACGPRCRLACQHLHQLQLWQCINETVPLTALCDGASDCEDGTDEKYCNSGDPISKFEARKKLNDLIVQVNVRIKSKDYVHATSQLQSLIKQLIQLQPSKDNSKLKENTDKVLRSLTTLYVRLGKEITNVNIEEEVYQFLGSIKVGVLEAVMRQREVVQKIKEGLFNCHCNGTKCSMPNCGRSCERKCAAGPQLRMISCGGVKVAPAAICNYTQECTNGLDERNCQRGFCQKYHLLMIKRHAEAASRKHAGTYIGEIFKVWENNVKLNVDSQINSGRANRELLLALVKESIESLVEDYAAYEDRRRFGSDPLLAAMQEASKLVMSVLTSCSD